MNPPPNREVALFSAALELPASQRAAFLEEACADDPDLRLRLEALLRVHDQALPFLESPAPGAAGSPIAPGVPDATLSPVSPPAEKPGDRIGRYKLLQQIGEGGCGMVYMAEQEEPVRRRVALKVIKLGMDTKQVIARFEAERQALALMDHPHIAKVLDAGATDTGRPYFVMELVRGVKITDYCDENSLSTEERVELFSQVCQAVQHAHQKGIIHRDIKPSNILVADHDGVPVPKVIDFGVAKATTDQRLTDKTLFTAFEQFIGTPAYMSPEQAKLSGLDLDTRTDIYSLGVLLYELLTGKTPLDQKELLAAGLDEMRRTIREKEPARPSTRLSAMRGEELTTTAKHRHADPPQLVHAVRGDLDWIAMKCLEKDRARRYETANGLAMDIQRHLRCEPVAARPPSRLYEFQKIVRRHKFGVAAAAALILVLAVGVLVSTWEAVRATRAERQKSGLWTEAERARQNEASLRQTAQAEASRAEAAATDLKRTLSSRDFMQAARLVDQDNAMDALPFLARSLSANPANGAALARLTTLLTDYSWMLPTLSLRHEARVDSARFSPDGKWILTVSGYAARLWDAQTGRPVAEPMKHRLPVQSAHFSPDGKRIVTTSLDKTARVWDAQTGQPLTDPLAHGYAVSSAAFSPDGKSLLTTTFDRTVRVWNAQTGEPLTEPMEYPDTQDRSTNAVTGSGTTQKADSAKGSGKPHHVFSANVVGYANTKDGHTETFNLRFMRAQFSPDGQRILTAADGRVLVWSVQPGRPLTEPMEHDAKVTSEQFGPDGKTILTVAGDMTIRVWDAQTGQALTKPMKHGTRIIAAQFSPDGQRVVTACEDRTARLWDAQTGQALGDPMKHDCSLSSANFSPDCQRIVTVSPDGAARMWDAQTGQPLTASLNCGNHLAPAAFSPDGKRILTVSGDGTVQVWDAQTGPALAQKLQGGHNSARFSPDGRKVLTVSRGWTGQVWDAQTGQALTEPIHRGSNVCSAIFSPDGRQIVTVSFDRAAKAYDQSARVWDAQTGELVAETLKDGQGVESAQFSPDGGRIVTVCDHQTARVWSARTGLALTKPMKHGNLLRAAHFSPEGRRIVTFSDGTMTARVWDAQTGELLAETGKLGHNARSAQFSPEGTRILTVSDDFARVWDAQTGQPATGPMKHPRTMYSAKFSPDGKRIVTTAADNTARVWEAQTGQPLTEPLAYGGWPPAAEFSPDGKRIVAALPDMSARVWDIQTGQPLTDPWKHGGSVSSVHFGPDGKRIVTASRDGARVWDFVPAQTRFPDWLFQLSEALSGQRLNQQGILEPTPLNRLEALKQIRQQLAQEPGDDDWLTWGRWLLADRATRTISPFSRVALPEYIENLIKEKTPESLAEAELLAVGNPEVLRRISEAREPPQQAPR